MDSRLAIRQIPESEEVRFYLNCYQADVQRENRALGGLAVIGAVLGLLALTLWLGGAVS